MKSQDKENKSSITRILLEQAINSLEFAIDSNRKNEVNREVQYSINVCLLLGIVSEGLINEIGEREVDTSTWQELEKTSTPLKWRIISGLKEGFEPSKEPMQTVVRLQKLRNKIAHPKLYRVENDIIISNEKVIKKNPEDSYELPEEDFTVYIGYGKLLSEFNSRDSYKEIRKTILAIKQVATLFGINDISEWINKLENDFKKIQL